MWNLLRPFETLFWTDMPWIEGGKELWEYARSNFDVTILSAIPNLSRSIHVIPGKEAWVKRELGDVPLILCKRKDKASYSAPGVILVDDYERNINDWNELGGIGVLHKTHEDSINQLQLLINERQ